MKTKKNKNEKNWIPTISTRKPSKSKKRKSKDDLVMTKKTEKKEYQPSSSKKFGGT